MRPSSGADQRRVFQVILRLAKLRFDIGDRGVDAIDLGFVLETSAFELGQRLIPGRFRELTRVVHCTTSSSRTACSFASLSKSPFGIAGTPIRPWLSPLSVSSPRLRLEHKDVLFGLGELGFELPHLVLVRAAVELEQRLALFHRHIFLDQHLGHEGRLGQARNELDCACTTVAFAELGVTNLSPMRTRRRNAQKQAKAEAPSRGEPEQLELEENKPEDREANNEYENCRGHDGRLLSGGWCASGTGASPLRRAIIAAVSRRSSSGK